MGKIERWLITLLAAALAVSLVITFAVGFSGRGEAALRISVIVHDEDDTQWEKFKLGMDQAAAEYNVEVNFVTLYDRNDVGQQVELIEREASNGAQAIILSPAGKEDLAAALEKSSVNMPLILMEGTIMSDKVSRRICADQETMGYRMGLAMKKDGVEKCVVYTGDGSQSFIGERLKGLRRAFEENGTVYTVTKEQPETYFWRGTEAVAALDDSLTGELCADGMSWRYGKKVYGFGSSDQLLRYLDDGELELLMLVSSYDEGYLGVQAAVEEIRKEEGGDVVLDFYEIKRDRIYQKAYQRLLFPAS
ncbi:MAG: substrate-binding domain-containing protein [Lachnospiraceae bacterium]|nr:substrate-binding domain-containing protein [Lachnospiraceae bacterium]